MLTTIGQLTLHLAIAATAAQTPDSSVPPNGPVTTTEAIATPEPEPNWSIGVGLRLFNLGGGLGNLGILNPRTYNISVERRVADSWWLRARFGGDYNSRSDDLRGYSVDGSVGARWMMLRKGAFEFSSLGDVFVGYGSQRLPSVPAGGIDDLTQVHYGFRGGLGAEWVFHRSARLRLSSSLFRILNSKVTARLVGSDAGNFEESMFSARLALAPTVEFRYAF